MSIRQLIRLLFVCLLLGCEYLSQRPQVPHSPEQPVFAPWAPETSLASVEGNADGYQGGETTAFLTCSNQSSPAVVVFIFHHQDPDPTQEHFSASIWLIDKSDERTTYKTVASFVVVQRIEDLAKIYEANSFRLMVTSDGATLMSTIDTNPIHQAMSCRGSK